MKTIPSTLTRLAAAVAVPAWLLVVPTLAGAQQRAVPRSEPAARTPSAPAPAPSAPAPSTPSTGRRSPSGDGERRGTAVPRERARTDGNNGSGSSGGSTTSTTGRESSTTGRDSSEPAPRSGGGEAAARRRERGDQPVIATAVRRRTPPGGTGGGRVIIVPGGYGFYPWGYGGLGLGGYYGGYYDPFDPFGYAGYGGYGGYPYGGGYPVYSSQDDDDDGAVRIKVKPREASVYVDGYFVGNVDDFDGVFQRLHLAAGPHRLEIRAQDYEPLMVDVRIEPDHTITYHGEMRRIQ